MCIRDRFNILFSQDTFSIIAVDTLSREVGSAGASCIAGSIIISDVHPGLGAIHTQSYWNPSNQNNASQLFQQGFSPQYIIDWLISNDVQNNSSIRQYGIVDLIDGGRSAAFTGNNCFDITLVIGYNLVPLPPANTIPFIYVFTPNLF